MPLDPTCARDYSPLPDRLAADWQRLCAACPDPSTRPGWADHHALHRLAGLQEAVARIQRPDGGEQRDAVLLALLTLAQGGDDVAGRVVLHALLPRALRLAGGLLHRPDVRGDRDEACALATAALWQAVMTYPLSRRPAQVAANLSMDALALVQRGHTGSSRYAPTYPELPLGDMSPFDRPTDPGDAVPDAELLELLAWAVRARVVNLAQARMLARVYALDGQPADVAAAARLYKVSCAGLRQRCHRLARRIGQATLAEGLDTAEDVDRAGPLAA